MKNFLTYVRTFAIPKRHVSIAIILAIGGVVGGTIGGLIVGIMVTIHQAAPASSTSQPDMVTAIKQSAWSDQPTIQPATQRARHNDESVLPDDTFITVVGTYEALDSMILDLRNFALNTPGLEVKDIIRTPARTYTRPTASITLSGPWDFVLSGLQPGWHGYEIYKVQMTRDYRKNVVVQ